MFSENLALKTRKCKECQQDKIPADFPPDDIKKGTAAIYCRSCTNIIRKAGREKKWGKSNGKAWRHPWTG